MANTGTPINYESFVPAPPEQVFSNLQMALTGNSGNYFDGVQIAGDGRSFITVTRRFVPGWAIGVAVVGFLFAFIGLIALAFRTTEVANISLTPVEGGTMVRVSGTTGEVQHQMIGSAIKGLGIAR